MINPWHLPRAANDNSETPAQWRARQRDAEILGVMSRKKMKRWPLETEHSAGRVDLDLMEMADEIDRLARVVHSHHGGMDNPHLVGMSRMIGAEITANSRGILHRLEDACGHLWDAVDLGVLKRLSMREIGKIFGAANDNAPAIGREKVIDGLKLAQRAYARLLDETREIDQRFGIETLSPNRRISLR